MSGAISVTSAIILTTIGYLSHEKLPLSRYIRMKFIVGLSSLALFSLSSVAPSLAASQLVSRSTESSLSSQSLPSAAKTIQVADLFNSVNRVLNTVEREKKRAEQRTNRERARQERLKRQENAARIRQERMEAYQKQQQERAAAAAARREQERKYFESLTPEQQKEYIARQRARDEAAATLFINLLGATMGSGNPTVSPSSNVNQEWIVEDRNNSRPAPQPAPAPVTPIGGNSGLHGECHYVGC
ncbi:hypothetical protein [Halotia branconii]|uniref:Uncharacterized protein n=1 Tax=Halotia branconii CENA392 TaxID=1539056 RepID=A0AAJ6P8I9_9CYAN|nr:hypothetical protein [Halotia branconii]WGV24687.1 hypothetical protein QI031_23415 [Halotia branconii CENA392]